jgi:hypothetical protein
MTMFEEQRRRGIAGEIRKFEEEVEVDYIPLRMISIHKAEEAMQRAITERDNPTRFCAQAIKRRETARPSRGIARDDPQRKPNGDWMVSRQSRVPRVYMPVYVELPRIQE